MTTLMPLPRSTFLIVLNLAIALIVGAIGFGVGFAQGQVAQTVMLFTVITVAALFWFTNYVALAFENRSTGAAEGGEVDAVGSLVGVRSVWAANRVLIVAMVLLLLAYLIITATVPPFRTQSVI
jgi:ribose transport system permease protein